MYVGMGIELQIIVLSPKFMGNNIKVKEESIYFLKSLIILLLIF